MLERHWFEGQDAYLPRVRAAMVQYDAQRDERASRVDRMTGPELTSELLRVRGLMTASADMPFKDRGCAFRELVDDDLAILEQQVGVYERAGKFLVPRDDEIHEILDVMFVDGITGESVVSGGVFRSAAFALFDELILHAVRFASRRDDDAIEPRQILGVYPLRAGLAGAIALHRLGVTAHAPLGVKRNEQTIKAEPPYYKRAQVTVPEDAFALVTDIMLAGGDTAVSTIRYCQELGIPATRIMVVAGVATPEGIDYVFRHYPEVGIIAASVQGGLDSSGYIKRARLGGAGRMFCDGLLPEGAWGMFGQTEILTTEERHRIFVRTREEQDELRAAAAAVS